MIVANISVITHKITNLFMISFNDFQDILCWGIIQQLKTQVFPFNCNRLYYMII